MLVFGLFICDRFNTYHNLYLVITQVSIQRATNVLCTYRYCIMYYVCYVLPKYNTILVRFWLQRADEQILLRYTAQLEPLELFLVDVAPRF